MYKKKGKDPSEPRPDKAAAPKWGIRKPWKKDKDGKLALQSPLYKKTKETIGQKKERQKLTGRKKWTRIALISLCVILALILILVVSAWWYFNHLLDQINYVEEESRLSSEEADQMQTGGLSSIDPNESLPDIGEITFPTEDPEYVPDAPQGDIVNILLIGQDRRPGEGRARSDSMILVTFNRSNSSITMTSFMRDAYVQIPGYSPYKINASYQYGGMSLLNDTLKLNYGVDVHGNVAVDFSQFEDLIDMLGGVDLDLTQKEADHLNKGYGWSLTAGRQRVNGEVALAYSRVRYIDNDYRRAERQRKVLQSLIDRYKSLSVGEMMSVLEKALGYVSTNIEKNEIMNLAVELFPMLASCSIQNQQIPAEGTFQGGDIQVRPGKKDWFQYNIDFATNREILREIFDED